MTLKSEATRSSRPETPRARDRPPEKSRRDSRDDPPHPKTNGLAPPAMDRDRENTASPRSTIQVNGTRPHSDSGRSTPRKPEAAKASLPALLSPLHPSLVEQLDELETDRKRTGDKAPPKSSKTNGPTAAKKPKSTLRIPPLLSPTLPPIVEAELARLKKTPPKIELNQRSANTPESPTSARKTKPQPEEEEGRPLEASRIVTLKLKKAMAKRAKELLSLPSKSIKDALRKERSMSVEGTPPPARKRPRLLDDAPIESSSLAKRNKTTGDTVVARPAGPSTPLKQSTTAMSRVTSSQSHGTPGNSTGLTPGALDRPPTRADSVEPARARAAGELLRDRAAVEAFREKHEEYRMLGGKLKRQRDDIVRGGSVTAAEERRANALTFEMVLAYMVAFYSLNQARILERKVLDFAAWESLLPHLTELKRRVQGNRSLRALALQMHAICLEQITASFHTLDPAAAATCFQRWAKMERARAPLWVDAVTACDGVEDRRMKTLVGPWTKVDDAAAATLNILRRWAEREDVQWAPVILKERERDRDRDRDRERDRERETDRNRERERDRDRERDRERVNGARS